MLRRASTGTGTSTTHSDAHSPCAQTIFGWTGHSQPPSGERAIDSAGVNQASAIGAQGVVWVSRGRQRCWPRTGAACVGGVENPSATPDPQSSPTPAPSTLARVGQASGLAGQSQAALQAPVSIPMSIAGEGAGQAVASRRIRRRLGGGWCRGQGVPRVPACPRPCLALSYHGVAWRRSPTAITRPVAVQLGQ